MVLIFSSFTMASAVRAAQLGNRRWLVRLLAVTLACGFAFLGVKFVEYKDKWEEGLLTGGAYHPEAPPPGAIVPQSTKRSFRRTQSRDRWSRRVRNRKRLRRVRTAAHREIDHRPGRRRPAGHLPAMARARSRPRLERLGRPRAEQRANLLRHLFRHDRPARRPRPGRHGRDRLDPAAGGPRRVRPRATSPPSISPASTGTWWT